MKNKRNGIYYTPPELAEYLAKPLLAGKNQEILDPAYGEGSLLLAVERILKSQNGEFNVHLFGCDTKPVNGLLKHLPQANLLKMDFFDFPADKKFQTILMNPPYVRHHLQNENKISKYRASNAELEILDYSADLWALFIIKAVSHLKQNGSIGAILPWAFLQADYAKPLRKWLSERFRKIKVVALSEKYFEKADERVVVIWLEEFGSTNESINCGASNQIETEINFNSLSLSSWLSDRVLYTSANNAEELLNKYKFEFGFQNFSDVADVKIGVVSGAVKHFVLTKEKVKGFGIQNSRLIPILTMSDEFKEYLRTGTKHLKQLVVLKRKDHLRYKKFISVGIAAEYNLRAHSQQREPWYAVRIGEVPDAFFQYRITKIPYLLPNKFHIQSTNAIHRIYFRNLTTTEKKWIYVSMLSAPSQLSIEINSKTYGRVLKIEPKSLKNSLIVKKRDSKINSVYKKIMELLAQNKKEDAMHEATMFISNELKIPNEIIDDTLRILNNLHNFR
jgi:adenine-specific DNA-methyltransferase